MAALGDDRLNGGAGIDTASYSDATGDVFLSLATGVSSGVLGADTFSGIENLTGGAFRDVLHGNSGANVLDGGAGDDAPMFGLEGDDTLIGGLGDELLCGGAGIDTASYSDATGGVTANLGTGVSEGDRGVDTFDSIENLSGGAFGDLLQGNFGVNVLNGGAGDDLLDGGNGDDDLVGEAGDDDLDGDAGNDTLRGGPGGDVLSGGAGVDDMTGGEGADRFFYLDIAELRSLLERIDDFSQGEDVIDLGQIDAIAGRCGQRGFHLHRNRGVQRRRPDSLRKVGVRERDGRQHERRRRPEL